MEASAGIDPLFVFKQVGIKTKINFGKYKDTDFFLDV